MDNHLDTKTKAKKLRDEGKSLRAIAQELGISKTSVANLVRTKSLLNPQWTTLQGQDESPVDSFGAIPPPSVADLLELNEDTVYSCTDWLAKEVAGSHLRVLVRTHHGQAAPKAKTIPYRKGNSLGIDTREVVDHASVDLLNHPNREQSKYDFLYSLDASLSLAGESFVFIERENYARIDEKNYINEGLPVALWILLVQYVEPVSDKGNYIGYVYSFGSKVFYKRSDVIHFKLINPTNPYGSGYGPVRACYERILLQKNELAYLLSLFRNQARPDSLILIKGGVGEDQCERLEKEMSMRFRRGGIGGIWAVDAEMLDVKPLGWSPKDLFGTELYKFVKLQIINCFSLNPALFDTESSNRAVATEARRTAQAKAVKPRLRLITEKINHVLLPEFDERLYAEFDSPVEEDRDFDLQVEQLNLVKIQTLGAISALTKNEARELLGFSPIPGGQQLIKPAAPTVAKGGEGSGDWGHQGRAGELGGSGEGGGLSAEAQVHTDTLSRWERIKTTAMAAVYKVSELVGGNYDAVLDTAEEHAVNMLSRGFQEGTGSPVSFVVAAKIASTVLAAAYTKIRGKSEASKDDPKFKQAVEMMVPIMLQLMGYDPKTLEYGQKKSSDLTQQFATALANCFKQFASTAIAQAKLGVHKTKSLASDWVAGMRNSLTPIVRLMFQEGSAAFVAEHQDAVPLLPVAKLNQHVDRLVLDLAESTLETTSQEVNQAIQDTREAIRQGLDKSEANNLLTGRIQEIFEDLSTTRAYLIADTEATRVKASSELATARESGLEMRKEWLPDSMACGLCLAAAELGAIPLDEPFAVMNAGSYGTIQHPPHHPGCRCALTYKIDE